MGITIDRYHDYYADDGNHGSYAKLSLQEIIDSFTATYVGKNKLCENVVLADITFHAIRGLQELSYDTLRSTKDWEVVIPSTLVMIAPIDYVNYVRVSWTDGNGIERIIYPTNDTSNPRDITPTLTDNGAFDATDNAYISNIGEDTDLPDDESSTTMDNYSALSTSDITAVDADAMDEEYGRLIGGRYGLSPEHAQANGSFYIDEDQGKFHFSSNLSGKTIVLRYISDGIVSTSAASSIKNLAESYVPKLAEEAIYKHILYGVLSARKDTDQNILALVKKERFAETRKAKMRLSNMKLGELTQIFRGSSKIIKH